MSEHTQENQLGTVDIGVLIRKFSIPAIISMLVSALYNIVDQIFIGRGIGLDGMAATNVAFPLTTICTSVALLLGIGGASNFSLNLGRKNPEEASLNAGNSLSLLVIFGVSLCAVVLAFLNPLLYIFGATENIMEYAVPYTAIVAIGMPFQIFSTGASNLIRADGSPNYSMGLMLAGAIFNVVFDPIFLFVFDMGIAGIALATTLGQVLTTVLAAIYLLRRFHTVSLRREHLRPRLRCVKAICSLGAASCFNQLAMTATQIVMNNTLRHYGALSHYGSEIPLASVGAITKINVLVMSFVIGTAQGCQPIIGYNYGAKQYARVKQTFKIAAIFCTIVSIIAFLVFQLFPHQVIAIFGEGSELYFEFATQYLRVFMVMTFINGLQPVTANLFTSIGRAKLGLWMSLTRQVLFLIPLILIFPLFLGIDGVMYAGPIADTASAVLAAIFVVREFRRMTALEREEADLRLAGGV